MRALTSYQPGDGTAAHPPQPLVTLLGHPPRLPKGRLECHGPRVVTLVYPDHADAEDRVSIVSPLGTALLGYPVGDEIHRETPGVAVRVRGDELLYQPEAGGDYRL